MTDEPRRRGPSPQTLSDTDRARLDGIRAEASTVRDQLLTSAPDDPLGALAWISTVLDPTAAAKPIATAMDRARAADCTWRQISEALNEGNTREDGRRIMDRHRSWVEGA